MRKYLLVIVPFILTLILVCTFNPVPVTYYTPTAEFLPPLPKHIEKAIEADVIGIQVPIPCAMRVYNSSGHQCVWCTLESLGMYNKSQGTSALTTQYKNTTGANEVALVLGRRHVKFLQTINAQDKKATYKFLEEWVTKNKKGCGIALYPECTHMVTIVDFQRGKSVKIIDNGDEALRVQTWSWEQFERDYYGWAIVILPDPE